MVFSALYLMYSLKLNCMVLFKWLAQLHGFTELFYYASDLLDYMHQGAKCPQWQCVWELWVCFFLCSPCPFPFSVGCFSVELQYQQRDGWLQRHCVACNQSLVLHQGAQESSGRKNYSCAFIVSNTPENWVLVRGWGRRGNGFSGSYPGLDTSTEVVSLS